MIDIGLKVIRLELMRLFINTISIGEGYNILMAINSNPLISALNSKDSIDEVVYGFLSGVVTNDFIIFANHIISSDDYLKVVADEINSNNDLVELSWYNEINQSGKTLYEAIHEVCGVAYKDIDEINFLNALYKTKVNNNLLPGKVDEMLALVSRDSKINVSKATKLFNCIVMDMCTELESDGSNAYNQFISKIISKWRRSYVG